MSFEIKARVNRLILTLQPLRVTFLTCIHGGQDGVKNDTFTIPQQLHGYLTTREPLNMGALSERLAQMTQKLYYCFSNQKYGKYE